MIRLAIIIPTFLLSGCLATAPVERNFPEVPEELKVACPNLKEIDQGTDKLSKVIEVVSENYAQYHECKLKIDNWILWYNSQKKIFDSVK